MNILLTSTGFIEDRELERLIQAWRDRYHIIEPLLLERLINYVRFDPAAAGRLWMQSCVKRIPTQKALLPTRWIVL